MLTEHFTETMTCHIINALVKLLTHLELTWWQERRGFHKHVTCTTQFHGLCVVYAVVTKTNNGKWSGVNKQAFFNHC